MAKLTDNPLVSIVIPVYNGSNYLREAIDSALAQTYKNIEILVINDGSNDHGATEKIAKSYGDKIRYFAKENGGVATALNLGIKKMKGEYFSWLSHDDLYYPSKVATQIKVLSGIFNKQTILYSSCELIDETGATTGSTNRTNEYTLSHFDHGYFALFKGLMNGCTMLIHKDNFNKVGLFDPKFPTTQDYQLWYDMFKLFPVKFVNKDLVKSRIHSQQGSIADSNHSNEADELWLRMIKEITADDVSGFVVNLNIFYKNVAKHLEVSPLRKAYGYAQKMVDESRDLVSVILPTYNRDYCIKTAMESVYAQNHAAYELIIVDDGSTDGTEKIVNKYKNEKTVYVKQENGGVSRARNAGIRLANGNYIAFLDSDDYWDPKHLEEHVTALTGNPVHTMSYNNYRTEGPGSVDDGHAFYPVSYPEILFISRSVITTPSVVVRSDILDEVGLFDEDMKICEDLDLWRRIAKAGPIKEINKVLTTVTLRDNHYSIDEYLGKRYDFLKKAFSEDDNLERITISRLLLELWTVYFSGGASLSTLYRNMEQAFEDFDYLHVYLRDKIGRGEFGFYLNEDNSTDEKKRKSDERVAFIRNGVRRYRSLKSSHGITVATKRAAKKVSAVIVNKGRRVWSNRK